MTQVAKPRAGRHLALRALVLAVALPAPILAADPALASWPMFGRAICTAPNDQINPRAISDDAGGAIITWQDDGPGVVDIFAQHVLASGAMDVEWPTNGRALLNDPAALANAAGGQAFPVIVSDGAGGAIVAWQDGRSGTSGIDIYAQHVLASGFIDGAWPPNGVALCTVSGTQNNLALVSDGARGAIVTWMDERGGAANVDIYAQHVVAPGVVDPNWFTNGVAMCTAAERQAMPKIASDNAGGAIVTWYDFRDLATSGIDIYAQHVSSSGTVDRAWPTNGRALCTAPNGQLDPTTVPDGAQGAIVAWLDARDGASHIFAQHVLATGAADPAWPANGRIVCSDPTEQISPILVSDDVGGAIVSWEDKRSGVHNMFAQHVLATGIVDPAWKVDGTALSTRPSEQSAGVIVEDGGHGAIVAWQDGFDIFAQHIMGSGEVDPAFPVDGQQVTNLTSVQDSPTVAAAGAGGAIVAWTDLRSGSTSDIYALRLQMPGTTGVGDPTARRQVRFARPSPNPALGAVTLKFLLSRDAHVALDIHDAGGRRIRRLAYGLRAAGEHVIEWDLRDESGHTVGAGLYFARLESDEGAFARKIAKLD